ncbi:MAG: dihydropteridine reductase [Clostridia bacterium]|nr:dihydropteridine reductase [Clostridia bacterium]
MSINEMKAIERIRNSYTEYQPTKFDELKELNKRVKRPAEIFAYTYGSVGALVLGTGMCLAMKIIGNLMPLGIIVGLAGIAMVSSTYSLSQAILKSRKKKYQKRILALSNELLNK